MFRFFPTRGARGERIKCVFYAGFLRWRRVGWPKSKSGARRIQVRFYTNGNLGFDGGNLAEIKAFFGAPHNSAIKSKVPDWAMFSDGFCVLKN